MPVSERSDNQIGRGCGGGENGRDDRPSGNRAAALSPQAQQSALFGLTDLFAVADRLAGQRLGQAKPRLRVSHLQPDGQTGAILRSFDTHPGMPGSPAIVIAPPSLGAPPQGFPAALLAWLRERHRAGTVLASVCAGAFLLAETGLLSGRSATTHWNLANGLAERFPDIRVDADKLIIDHGDILTAGGLMAWIDLGLTVVERLLGPIAMTETAHFMLVDPPGREQRYYRLFSPKLGHGDAAVLKVQHWLQTPAARHAGVGEMAAKAGLEKRTFLRRFHNATGLKPLEYCQHLRVGRAREMLEAGPGPIDQIAWEVGYADAASFRKVFARITGLSPGEYRRRFRVGKAVR